MKPVSGKKFCKILEKRGWTLVRVKGSHYRFLAPDESTTIDVPVHGNKDMRIGTQHGLMKAAGLTEDDL